MTDTQESPGTLAVGETHPAARNAYSYIKHFMVTQFHILEAFASCAMAGNRMAEVCYETLNRIRNNEPVSDRYILGLAWFLKEMEENDRRLRIERQMIKEIKDEVKKCITS